MLAVVLALAAPPPALAQAAKPNILFIVSDDTGWMEPSVYHRGLMVGETPNIDRIGDEGAHLHALLRPAELHARRNAFFTGLHPHRSGMIRPQLPGSPTYLRPARRRSRQVPERGRLPHGRVHRQVAPRRPHDCAADGARLPGDLGLSLSPQRHAGASASPTSTRPPPTGDRASRARYRRSRGSRRLRARSIRRTTTCMTPSRTMLGCTSADGTTKNQRANTSARPRSSALRR